MVSHNFPTDATIRLSEVWALVRQGQLSADQFVELVQLNAPNYGEYTMYHDAIQLALDDEYIQIARRLVETGLHHFPDSELLRRDKAALQPAKVVKHMPAQFDLSQTMRWLSAHSQEYRGQWIAVHNGELLGVAASRKALVDPLGEVAQNTQLLITRVPGIRRIFEPFTIRS